MNQLKEVVNAVLEQQKLQLAPSTYDARKNYLKHLVEYGDYLGIQVPCQELYDAYVARAVTPDLRFQLLHAVRLVDKEAGTKALTPEGKLYNEPKLPSSSESEEVFRNIFFPISDGRIDMGHLIRRAESEMAYIKDFLGHSSIDSTSIYAHADNETMAAALRSVDQEALPVKSSDGNVVSYPEKKWKGKEEYLLHFCGLD